MGKANLEFIRKKLNEAGVFLLDFQFKAELAGSKTKRARQYMIVFPVNCDGTPIDQTQAGFEVPRVVPDFTTVLSHCSHVEPRDLELFLVPDSRPEYLAWLASRTDALQKKAEKKAGQKDHEQCWKSDHLEAFRQVAKMKGAVLK